MEASDRHGLATLAAAYGVPPDVPAVAAAIRERFRGPTHAEISIDTLADLPVEWRAIMQIVAQLAVHPGDLARVRRGKRPTSLSWTAMTTGVGAHALPLPVEPFIDEVIAEIASSLAEAG